MFLGKNLTNIRILHGYTRKQLAELLQLTEQSVWQYENGYTSPKMEVVNHLKQIFRVKSQYFYTKDLLANSNLENINMNHIAYRSTTINSVQKTQCEATHVQFIDAFLERIEKEIVYPSNDIERIREASIKMIVDERFERIDNINRIATYAREFLGLEDIGNANLLFLLEKKGVFILEKSIGEKVDAYSLWTEDDRPYIILGNIKKSAARRNFDLAHELGHLLLHFRVEFNTLDKKSYREYEREANLFASAFLLPEDPFKQDVFLLQKKSNPDSYIDLKKKWSVSIQAMVYRAYALKLITYQQYRYFNMAIHRKNYKTMEPLDDILKIQRPGKVRSILQLLFERGYLSLDSLLNMLNVDIEFLIHLLGIERAFFEQYNVNTTKYFSVDDLRFNDQ